MPADDEHVGIKEHQAARTDAPPKSAQSTSAGARKRVWDFLNSNFGIWLLSTVVVGIGSYLVTTLIQDQANRTQTLQTLYCLKWEIRTDAHDAETAFGNADTRTKYYNAFNELQYPKEKLLDYPTATMDRYAYELELLGSRDDKTAGENVAAGMDSIWKALSDDFTGASDSTWNTPIPHSRRDKIYNDVDPILKSDLLSIVVPSIDGDQKPAASPSPP
jgi:hypothetical protein